MGNGPHTGEKTPNDENEDGIFKKALQLDGLNRRQSASGLIFFAGTDKARVITEILEERGWSRTKDNNVTNFTIKWCLAHQVDWNQFQEGKQLINNIPGQLAFSDKINLWYTIRDYLRNKRTLDGNHIQTFLPMTFVLDEENEIADFLRSYKKQNRTWICKPRYSYAGRGIYVLSGGSDLNSVFKFKVGTNNRFQYEPRLPGYLMQEYISRPLLIKGRKFDIRVHWLVAWTKPLLVFYNHNASVVRLSLNLYRELDFDRATHLTNLSVQENHCRYACEHEATGMTINQLNHYFNQCFRPFHPKMCQDWVMTVMQERMQTIIRHVIRASKDKLTRGAGQFGLYGCDFLLDENFRIWLLEINDNPGVGWGNPRVNTTTKPLFEETLNIVFECFEKYKKDESLLPIECLKNYQLIYNEDNDTDRLLRDDNQIYTERLAIRYALKEASSRTSFRRILPRVNTSRTSMQQNDDNNNNNNNDSDIVLPSINLTRANSIVVDTISPSPSIVDTTTLNPPVADIIPPTGPIIDTKLLTPSKISTQPVILSLVDATPSTPLRLITTPVNISLVDIKSLNSSKIITTPLSLSVVTSTPLSSSIVTATSLSPITINNTDDTDERIESLKHDDDIRLECLMKPKIFQTKSFLTTSIQMTRQNIKINKVNMKRTLSNTNSFGIQRKKRIDLTPITIDSRRYLHRHGIIPPCTETTKTKDKISKNQTIIKDEKLNKIENKPDPLLITTTPNIETPELYSYN